MNSGIKKICISVILLAGLCLAIGFPQGALASPTKPALVVPEGGVTISPGSLMAGDTAEISVLVLNSLKSAGAGNTTTSSSTYSYGAGMSNGLVTPSHTDSTQVTSTDSLSGLVYLERVTLIADSAVPVRVISGSFGAVGSLGMGDSARFSFVVRANDNATDGVYFLRLNVTTRDSEVYLSYPVRVEIDNTQVKLIISESPASFSTSKKSIVMDVVNMRGNAISGVSVVPAGDDFVFKPVQEYYVGNIGPSEMYTVQFDVTAKDLKGTGLPSFKVVYRNGDNWHETQAKVVTANRDGPAQSSSNGDGGMLLYVVGAIVIILAIAIGLFFLLRRKR